MRLENYLNEKYYDTFKQTILDKGMHDVFVNPSKKEIKEVEDVEGSGSYRGYRYIIDFKNKKFYVFDINTFHVTVMDNITGMPNHKNYWTKKEGLDWIWTGNTELGVHKSDMAINIFQSRKNEDNREVIQTLYDQDWSWMKKYVNVEEIRHLIGRSL